MYSAVAYIAVLHGVYKNASIFHCHCSQYDNRHARLQRSLWLSKQCYLHFAPRVLHFSAIHCEKSVGNLSEITEIWLEIRNQGLEDPVEIRKSARNHEKSGKITRGGVQVALSVELNQAHRWFMAKCVRRIIEFYIMLRTPAKLVRWSSQHYLEAYTITSKPWAVLI